MFKVQILKLFPSSQQLFFQCPEDPEAPILSLSRLWLGVCHSVMGIFWEATLNQTIVEMRFVLRMVYDVVQKFFVI